MVKIPVGAVFGTEKDFLNYVKSIKFDAFKPRFCVLHATGIDLKSWRTHTMGERIPNIFAGYKKMGWHSGPHIFIDEISFGIGCPLNVSGVHSPSWNDISFGIEQAGWYWPGRDVYPESIQNRAVTAIAALNKLMGVAADTLKFHYEDSATTHRGCPCPPAKPGEKPIIDKAVMIELIDKKMKGI